MKEPKKITEYKVIELSETKSFRESMAFHISKGYQPYGLPYVSPGSFIQTVVKYIEESK